VLRLPLLLALYVQLLQDLKSFQQLVHLHALLVRQL
jgi:hypothetical protein